MPEGRAVRGEYPELDHLQAGLLLLMDQYAETPCRSVAVAVTMQMERLLDHPLIDLLPELQRQCCRGLNRWRARTLGAAPWSSFNSSSIH